VRIVNVILAAGHGTRMKSDLPKVMHPLAGRHMVEWSVRAAEVISQRPPVIVVGYGREQVQALLGNRVEYVVQEQLLGTGHAVQQTAPLLRGQADAVVVAYADMPLLRADTLGKLIETFKQTYANDNTLAIAMLVVERDDPQGFGRVVRNHAGEIVAIVEEVDCTPEQKRIRELNPGIYCFHAEWLWQNLPRMPVSPKGEYYITDMIGIAVSQGRRVVTIQAPAEEVNGINTRVHLAMANEILHQRILEQHMLAGVTIVGPKTTYIEDTVEIEADTTILPGCLLQGATKIGAHSIIGPYSQLMNSVVGRRCRVMFSVLEQARIEDQCIWGLGPKWDILAMWVIRISATM
jgi:bifunctional UDP-N-acetylglucosamine pyrophosphorylase/glucosamine-1-phosphate N-acetyltransferase